jgi:hypothetical protein
MAKKKPTLSISDEQIKRLDKVVQIKQDPLAPFKGLISFLVDALAATKNVKDVTFNRKELIKHLPKRSDVATLSLLLPGAFSARLAETGYNDPGDSDHNLYDTSDNDPGSPDPEGD